MRPWVALLVALMLLLTACGAEPEVTAPKDTTPEITAPKETVPDEDTLVYDMSGYQYFSDIFEEKAQRDWDAMGHYTLRLTGLCTPVTVRMEGRKVQSVSAYGYAEAVNIGLFQDYIPADIQSAGNVVLVNETLDYEGSTWIFTADGCYTFRPEGAISTQVFAGEDGKLRYRRYWGEYQTTFEQVEYAPLYYCTSRDHFLYENGVAEIVDGEVILTPETTTVASDLYDLDAMFAQAKAEGEFSQYDTVDDLLAANGEKDTAS